MRLALATLAVVVLAGYGYGAHRRNAVWHDEESLWRDDVQKSPHNGRGLMIYGLTQMNKGDYAAALDYFTRALALTPNYATLEINLGVVNWSDGRSRRERPTRLRPRPTSSAPSRSLPAMTRRMRTMAAGSASMVVRRRPSRSYGQRLRSIRRDRCSTICSSKPISTRAIPRPRGKRRRRHLPSFRMTRLAQQTLRHPQTLDCGDWINLSLVQYKQAAYAQSIASARKALQLDPNSVEAYTNIGAAYGALHQWDEAIRNEREALRLKPDFQLAKNNLNWYLQQSASDSEKPGNAHMSTDAFIDESLRLNQAGKYQQSIAAARKALQLNPNSAEAWNNIAANDEALQRWDDAIAAARKAIALKPDFQLAKNNLAWSLAQKGANVAR